MRALFVIILVLFVSIYSFCLSSLQVEQAKLSSMLLLLFVVMAKNTAVTTTCFKNDNVAECMVYHAFAFD